MKKFVVSAFTALTMMASPAAFAQTATSAQPRAYMIGSYDIKDQAGFQQYIKAASPLVTQYGGRVIVYSPNVSAIEGSTRSVIEVFRVSISNDPIGGAFRASRITASTTPP